MPTPRISRSSDRSSARSCPQIGGPILALAATAQVTIDAVLVLK